MQVPIIVDRRAAVPLQRQIYEQWRAGILAGRFAPGDRVPSTRALAEALGVARATVTGAYDQLLAEGYFDAARGAGTYICGELPDPPPRRQPRAAAPSPAPIALSGYGVRLHRPANPAPAASGLLNLSAFGADLERFPFALWRRLLGRYLRRPPAALFARAERAAGYPPLREQIAAYLSRSRAVRCSPDQVLVVNGSQQALDLCVRLFVDPGDVVAMEDPGYPGVRELAVAAGARLSSIAVDDDGLRVGALPANARLVHVTPSHQFPSGASMSLTRRLELLAWARARGTVVIEDDYDSEYRYSGPPLPALQGLDADVPVVYVGTFSNVTFPAIRIGYVVVPPALVTPFARAKWLADRHSPLLDQAALADFMADGHLERHVRRTRRIYGRRREALLDALARHFGDTATVRGDAAGMHALVRFDAPDIARRAEAARVRLLSAAPYYQSGRAPHEFLFGFSAVSERALREGIRRLAS